MAGSSKQHVRNVEFHSAVKCKDYDRVKELLKPTGWGLTARSSVDVNLRNLDSLSALYVAIRAENTEMVELLLAQSTIDVNCENMQDKNNQRITPLQLAIRLGNAELVKLLLAHPKMNVNGQDEHDKSPLQSAIEVAMEVDIRQGNLEIVQLLLNHPNINANCQNEQGNTPLHVVIQARPFSETKRRTYDALRRMLLDSGKVKVSINMKNKQGNTPLHLACKRSDYIAQEKCKPVLSIIQQLLAKGANEKLLNNNRQSAVDLINNAHGNSIDYFESEIAKKRYNSLSELFPQAEPHVPHSLSEGSIHSSGGRFSRSSSDPLLSSSLGVTSMGSSSAPISRRFSAASETGLPASPAFPLPGRGGQIQQDRASYSLTPSNRSPLESKPLSPDVNDRRVQCLNDYIAKKTQDITKKRGSKFGRACLFVARLANPENGEAKLELAIKVERKLKTKLSGVQDRQLFDNGKEAMLLSRGELGKIMGFRAHR